MTDCERSRQALLQVPDLISSKQFQLGDVLYCELIRKWGSGFCKLVMVREPFNRTVVNGTPNPLFHADFKTGDSHMEGIARRRVLESLKSYYGISHLVPQVCMTTDVGDLE